MAAATTRGEFADVDREQAEKAIAKLARMQTRNRTEPLMLGETAGPPFNGALVTKNRDLRRLDIEWLELPGAALRILRRDGVAHDSGGGIIGHDPLGDPELTFGLLLGLAIAHGDLDGFAVVGQMNHELRGSIPLARRWVDGGHPEPYRLALFELVGQRTVEWLTGTEEEDGVAVNNQAIAAGRRLPGEKRACRHRR